MKLYQSVTEALNSVIKHYESEGTNDNFTDRDKHHLIEGLKVATQIVEQTEEIDTDELSYETLENALKIFQKAYIEQYNPEEFNELLNEHLIEE